MTFKEIQDLIKLINKSNITEFKLEDEKFKLSIRTKNFSKIKERIVTAPAAAAPAAAPIQATPPAAAPITPSETLSPVADNQETAEASGNYIEIRSPIVGTFYRSSSPEKPPYVKVGDVIEVGTVVCIVEAMKLFNEIESEVSGKIVKVMIEDAQPVEYDQVLYLVEPV
ncbi:MAG TPA: acetyl-CoA carboxylase biotin carboxyl carrier protein [Saprospiraceae bacterium]|nr:acetyl-CoA carboxylase biotin carboxyl carrier protein [Saprospiraceae bacterium]